MHAVPVCPLCSGQLATNVHPLERRLAPVMSVPLVIALALFAPFPGAATGVLLLAALVNCVAAAGYLHARTRTWQRYKRYVSESA